MPYRLLTLSCPHSAQNRGTTWEQRNHHSRSQSLHAPSLGPIGVTDTQHHALTNRRPSTVAQHPTRRQEHIGESSIGATLRCHIILQRRRTRLASAKRSRWENKGGTRANCRNTPVHAQASPL